ncbi:hypothetical protein FIBSPDRAFT_939809 [Athelia psychrophila]|uniref:Zn(2)-C6 fungal-type domain-containing protein n=1 Tax=Athelia psychrophila TaxID=1759441 RepID=A0A167X5Q0_9AGAM|nr:hypothetical protein FIBSPDRAFT_939809 [Fibularhizoctonia sp. CBS 109695]
MQFVIESPEKAQNQRKRPRLVTSCDSCRSKKIQCLQTGPENQCEACTQSKVPCCFGDRERYFAERSRASSQAKEGRSSKTPPRHKTSPKGSISEKSKLSHTAGACASTNYPHLQQEQAQYDPADDFLIYNNVIEPLQPCPFTNYAMNEKISPVQMPLFDPHQPRYPHKAFMPQFIQIFVNHLGAQCPFVTYIDTLERFNSGILPPLLSNAIAALAAGYSNQPELVVRGLDNVAEMYRENAMNILAPIKHVPTVETLHALMLLAWYEHHYGRIMEFRMYSQLAMRMALDLGLSAGALNKNISDRGRHLLATTWASVMQLNSFASTCV